MKVVCTNCGKIFKKRIWNQKFCGSKTLKTGCSYKIHIKGIQKYNQTTGKKKLLELSKKWQKRQRLLNTDYAKRQRKYKIDYSNSKIGKEKQKEWRKKNLNKVLIWNRKRLLKKRNIIGTHTEQEWIDLKNYFKNRCVLCGETEENLNKIWRGTSFNKLTKDHIVPLSRGGTDYIWNIQPLCVSCNSSKHSIRNEKIVAVSMGADPIHIGHLYNIAEAKKLGNRLIVILNNDNWLKNKNGKVFMKENERAIILMSIRWVDGVIITKHDLNDDDNSVSKELEMLKPNIFAKGGDRNISNIPQSEIDICKKYNIKIVNNVGGGKIQSSSWLKNGTI